MIHKNVSSHSKDFSTTTDSFVFYKIQILQPVFIWRKSRFTLKKPAKILGVFNPQFIGYWTEGFTRVKGFSQAISTNFS